VRKKFPIIVLSLIVGLSGCNRAHRPVAPDIRPEEYDAISGYLAYRFTGYEKNHEKLIFFNMTESENDDATPFKGTPFKPGPWQQTADFLRQQAPLLQQTTIDSYRKANTQQAFVSRSFHSPIDYKLVDSAERESYNQRGWPNANEVMTWSRVGFSADGTQALFYETNHFGRLNSNSRYIVIEKENGSWTIKKEIRGWDVEE